MDFVPILIAVAVAIERKLSRGGSAEIRSVRHGVGVVVFVFRNRGCVGIVMREHDNEHHHGRDGKCGNLDRVFCAWDC